jgi:Ca2+:H+ antiporter
MFAFKIFTVHFSFRSACRYLSISRTVFLTAADATGGLLNATFGNAVEIIISVTAMRASLFHVVQDAMLGSILSNLLLVLGMAFFAAGIQFQMCDFNSTAAQTTSSLLLLATMGIITPSVYALTAGSITVSTPFNQNSASATLSISRAAAVVLFSVYIGYLFFQIKTHSHLYEDEEEDDEGEDKQPKLSPFWACLVLVCVTALVALVANGLIGSIEAASHNWGISSTFAAIILIPIAGNAAEHISAIQAATDGRINLAIGIAVGSSVQIACGVFPFLVILGAIVGRPLDFTFQAFETVVTFICVIIVNAVVQDGESTWLEGFICISCYIIVAVSFFFR